MKDKWIVVVSVKESSEIPLKSKQKKENQKWKMKET